MPIHDRRFTNEPGHSQRSWLPVINRRSSIINEKARHPSLPGFEPGARGRKTAYARSRNVLWNLVHAQIDLSAQCSGFCSATAARPQRLQPREVPQNAIRTKLECAVDSATYAECVGRPDAPIPDSHPGVPADSGFLSQSGEQTRRTEDGQRKIRTTPLLPYGRPRA